MVSQPRISLSVAPHICIHVLRVQLETYSEVVLKLTYLGINNQISCKEVTFSNPTSIIEISTQEF